MPVHCFLAGRRLCTETWRESPLAPKAVMVMEKPIALPRIVSRQGTPQRNAAIAAKNCGPLRIVATYDLLFTAFILAREGLGAHLAHAGTDSPLYFRAIAPAKVSPMRLIWRKEQRFSKAAGLFRKASSASANCQNPCGRFFAVRHRDPPVGTEELAHLEMVGTIVYQLTRNLTPEQIREQGFDTYFVDHTTGVYPTAASGMPFSAGTIAVTGDTLADLNEDLAAEQKARLTYDNILRFADDPDVRDPIKFLRAREIVHYQRFGEGLRIATDRLDAKNFYAFNPSFDKS